MKQGNKLLVGTTYFYRNTDEVERENRKKKTAAARPVEFTHSSFLPLSVSLNYWNDPSGNLAAREMKAQPGEVIVVAIYTGSVYSAAAWLVQTALAVYRSICQKLAYGPCLYITAGQCEYVWAMIVLHERPNQLEGEKKLSSTNLTILF